MSPPAGYVVTPINQQPTRSVNDTAEYRTNYYAAEYVNALYALDNGWNGHGVTIGIIDDGANTAATNEFAGRINTALSKDFGQVTDASGTVTSRNSLGDAHSVHGTSTAAILAADQDGSGIEGYAPDAQLAILRVDDYNAQTGAHTYMHSDQAIAYAATEGLKVLSQSLVTSSTTPEAQTISVVTQFGATGGLLVNGAGNNSAATKIAVGPADGINVTTANRAAWLFVGAVTVNGTSYSMAPYSNTAGSFSDRFVVAPGTNETIDVDGVVTGFSGTSSATPVVAALAADIISKWPQLTGQQAGQVILDTAKNIGDASTYGKGLVNFQAALSPVNATISNGTTTSSVTSTTTGTGPNGTGPTSVASTTVKAAPLLAKSKMVLPSIVNAAGFQAALSNVTVLDQYGRNFSGSLSAGVIQAASQDGHWMRRRLQQMSQGNQSEMNLNGFTSSFGYVSYTIGSQSGDVVTKMTNGQMAFTSGSLGISAGINASQNVQSDIMGLAPFSDAILAYSPMADTSFGASYKLGKGKVGLSMATGGYNGAHSNAASLSYEQGNTYMRASLIQEHGSVFGYQSSGGLALGSGATTAVFEGRHSFDLVGGWSLEGYASVGFTKLGIDSQSVVTGASTMVSTRLGFQANDPALGGVVSFGIAQPLTVESGKAHLTTGNGYDLASQSLTYAHSTADLATAKREVQLTAGYVRGGPRASFRIGVSQNLADKSVRALLGYGFRF